MAEIGYFPTYSQQENKITNYTLLVLKQLYIENPMLFQSFIENLLADKGKNINVGVSFSQQKEYKCNAGKSIMDGVIQQKPFTIIIETKNFDWFSEDQIERHIQNIEGSAGIKVLLALANFDGKKDSNKIFDKIKEKYKNNENIIIQKVEFEEFLLGLKELNIKSEHLLNMIEEYEQFLNYSDLLPTWKYRLDVVNCAISEDSIKEHHVYTCPEAKGAYWHARAKYFGIYGNKKVDSIAEIKAVCEIDDNENNVDKISVRWYDSEKFKENEIINLVKDKEQAYPDFRPFQLFLLDNFKNNINFYKDTRGGMFASKIYFDFDNKINNIDDLVNKIQNQEWSKFKKN